MEIVFEQTVSSSRKYKEVIQKEHFSRIRCLCSHQEVKTYYNSKQVLIRCFKVYNISQVRVKFCNIITVVLIRISCLHHSVCSCNTQATNYSNERLTTLLHTHGITGTKYIRCVIVRNRRTNIRHHKKKGKRRRIAYWGNPIHLKQNSAKLYVAQQKLQLQVKLMCQDKTSIKWIT